MKIHLPSLSLLLALVAVSSFQQPTHAESLHVDTTVSSPTANLTRWYVEDADFLARVHQLTMPQAAMQAGIPIGAAVSDGLLHGSVPDIMMEFFPSHYSYAVMENGMKWTELLVDPTGMELGFYEFTAADAFVNYCVANDVRVRGPALIWGRNVDVTYPQSVMDAVEWSNVPNATLMEIMTSHINEVTGHFQGKIAVWEVVKEHLDGLDPDQNIFYQLWGDDYVKISFEIAKAALPDDDVSLIWNEGIANYSLSDVKISKWLELLQRYKDEGVPIDGIGIQGHTLSSRHNLTEAQIFLEKVVDMGYTVELTEMDAPITIFLDDEDPFQAQADYIGEYVKICFELPNRACKGVTFGGVSDAYTWYDYFFASTAPNLPLLIDENGHEKPTWLSVRQELLAFIAKTTAEHEHEMMLEEAGEEAESATTESEVASDDDGVVEDDEESTLATSAAARPVTIAPLIVTVIAMVGTARRR